jgi:uncharacterized SAM-binding protein YcdF (DUF218 family)
VLRRSRFRALLFSLVLVAALFLARSLWLPWLAYPLIHDDGPAKADVAVVLAGDWNGYRIDKAAALVRDGYVPYVLVSGPMVFDTHESDLAIARAVHRGSPAEWFVSLPHDAHSTREEGGVILAELRRRGIQRFLLVTSDYHTGRAGRIFRALERASGGGPEMRVVAAPDRYFHPESWWRQRQAQKTVLEEWLKTFATALGM